MIKRYSLMGAHTDSGVRKDYGTYANNEGDLCKWEDVQNALNDKDLEIASLKDAVRNAEAEEYRLLRKIEKLVIRYDDMEQAYAREIRELHRELRDLRELRDQMAGYR